MKDFFISYNKADRQWAEWIAWQLEEAGLTTVIQAWDFHAGSNFVIDMKKAASEAARTIAVLSPTYLTSGFSQSEWAAAFAKDPTGEKGALLPVRVRECDLDGLDAPIVYIDLVDRDEATAKTTLIAGIKRERAKPDQPVPFPDDAEKPVPMAERAVQKQPAFPDSLPPMHNITHPRNLDFVGRTEELDKLKQMLAGGSVAVTHAVVGEGGIGKTQLAVEFCYQHGGQFDGIWWIDAADEAVDGSTAALAVGLQLDLPDDAPADAVRQAVCHRLSDGKKHLLVLDNLDSEQADERLQQYRLELPSRLLITTRRADLPTHLVETLPLEVLSRASAIELLSKHRADLKDDAHQAALGAVAKHLGDHSLAVALAGSYLKRFQNVSPEDLLQRLQRTNVGDPDHLLAGLDPQKHGAGYQRRVAETLGLHFPKLDDSLAGRILSLAAFCHPRDIPVELFVACLASPNDPNTKRERGTSDSEDSGVRRGSPDPAETGDRRSQDDSGRPAVEPGVGSGDPPPTALDVTAEQIEQELANLADWSIVKYGGMIDIHPLTQSVIRTRLGESASQAILTRLVTHLAQVFADPEDHKQWAAQEPYARHADPATEYGQQLGKVEKTGLLASQVGVYQLTRARYHTAEPLMRRALAIEEQSYGAEHPDVAIQLNNLAQLLKATNRLAEAEPLMRRELAIDEQSYGAEHPKVAICLNNLAALLQDTNRLAEAEPLMRRALAIDEQSYGAEHPDVANRLNNLASLLQATNRLAEAEPLMARVVSIFEKSYGENHPNVATALNNLAQLLKATNRLAEAEPLMRRGLAIDEQSYGAEHPKVAIRLNNLAALLQEMWRRLPACEGPEEEDRRQDAYATLLAEAEPLMRRALAIGEQSLGPDHAWVANPLNNLALLLQATNRLAEAEPLMRRALAIDEQSYGAEHPKVAHRLWVLAVLLRDTERLADAVPLMQRSIGIYHRFSTQNGYEHPHWAAALGYYRGMLAASGLSEPEIAERLAQLTP